jgi:glutathione S-transferase
VYRWFEALEQRSAYTATQSDMYTHCWDIPPQYGNCYPPGGSEYAPAIDGKDGKSWHLPLPPLNAFSLEARTNTWTMGRSALLLLI